MKSIYIQWRVAIWRGKLKKLVEALLLSIQGKKKDNVFG